MMAALTLIFFCCLGSVDTSGTPDCCCVEAVLWRGESELMGTAVAEVE